MPCGFAWDRVVTVLLETGLEGRRHDLLQRITLAS
jgi:hypothetical protein